MLEKIVSIMFPWASHLAGIEKPKGCVHTLKITAVDSIIQARL
jgi:hypothetical protein